MKTLDSQNHLETFASDQISLQEIHMYLDRQSNFEWKESQLTSDLSLKMFYTINSNG